MTSVLSLDEITPTVFLKRTNTGLKQLVRLAITNGGETTVAAAIASGPDFTCRADLSEVPPGELVHELFIDEVREPTDIEFILEVAGTEVSSKTVAWQVPKPWTVHVVQRSHHDVGYTDLGSTVLRQHDEFLADAIAMAEATDDYPDDAKFRITVEQVWSLWHFLNNAPPKQVEQMLELIRAGRIEVTALFGNMTTELCGSEVLARTLYHAAKLKRDYGISVISAEHNDIPGLSWGMCELLIDVGIKIFCPGLPYYWQWGDMELQSFWDEEAIFTQGVPGAVWWEAPSGRRLLLWHSAVGADGDTRGQLPTLADRLLELEKQDYPYTVIRWPAIGGRRDNSPYIIDYAQTIKRWNEQWAYPHLICSTDAKFYADFAEQIPADLPVVRGELPGQDYPVGATSTAAATAANRNNHAQLPSAEKLATAASYWTDYPYQADTIFSAYEEVLWYDEHTCGHHSPCGPTHRASELEKAVHAYRAAALSHDVRNKAMARIADSVQLDEEGFHLVVFNAEQQTRTGVVRVSLREIDNCGATMIPVPPEEDPEGTGYWLGVPLLTRWHAVPPAELVEGKFELIDLATGESVPFQIIELSAPDEPVPYAPQRVGIGSDGKRIGGMEVPSGFKRDLCFVAEEVPACGYRTYRLVPKEAKPTAIGSACSQSTRVENEFYRIEVDASSGAIVSLYDKAADRELVDTDCPHSFNGLVVRSPLVDKDRLLEDVQVDQGQAGPICASLRITGRAYGHCAVSQAITLYDGLREVHFATRILKDVTPLLDAHLAFPFLADDPQLRYAGNLAVLTPIADYMPGAYWNRITVQNWVRVTDGDFNIVWSSLDAPVASFAGLWPDYLSPAHRCHIDERLQRPPVNPEQLNNGWIYSCLTHNNFGTNSSCVQDGDLLFRYVLTTRQGMLSEGKTALWARQAVDPMTAIFTENPRDGTLPPSASFARVDSDEVVLLACKQAEDGRGLIMRLWNAAGEGSKAKVVLPWLELEYVGLTNAIEEDQNVALATDEHSFTVEVGACGLATVRIIPRGES